MRQREPAHLEQVALSQRIKQFLAAFKVNPCLNHMPHQPEFCNQYHSCHDKRRNPYLAETFKYLPSDLCHCSQDDCPKCHNMYELAYHPLKYKTSKCYNYPCPYGFLCCSLHDQEPDMLSKYQFFRFDLETFKTDLCPHRQSNGHELASCHFYHNESDRRRNPKKVGYSHVQCSKQGCNDSNCVYAHNKIEQLYHPSRYKTKYCQSYLNKKSCQYHQYCSFAHSNQQIKIELLHQMPKTQHFKDYKYKTVWCPYTNPQIRHLLSHDRGKCQYAHNFQDYRRDLKKKHYTPQICPYWTKGEIKSIEDSGCPLGMDCPKSHGWFQNRFHPDHRKIDQGLVPQNPDSELPQKTSSDKAKSNGKSQKDGLFVLGAPFFKREIERSQSQSNKVEGSKRQHSRQGKSQKQKQKWFNFSIFLPNQESLSGETNQNQYCKTQVEAFWEPEKSEGHSNRADSWHTPDSPLIKDKISKRSRQYTKSLKQLLVRAGLEDKLSAMAVNQVKLLSLSKQDLDKLGLSHQEQEMFMNAINEYSKTHKQGMVKYTESMVKIFKSKALLQTLEKLKQKGVSQSLLQGLSSSTIDDLSFLEEEQKSSLPKILEEYADDRAFRELNTLIEKQTCSSKVRKSRPKRFSGWHCFKM